MRSEIRSFTDLVSWQESHKLVLVVYQLTEQFPQREVFSLTDQLRRAVVSISSNIAEGFSRATRKEKYHFYTVAVGSLAEVQNQLIIARDLGYIPMVEYERLAERCTQVSRLINGMIKYLSQNT